jgi:hypothetical protein
MRAYLSSFFIVMVLQTGAVETYSDSLIHENRTKLMYLGAGTATLYGGSMYALYQTWYSPYTSSKFHLFNDIDEWGGMDKVGHITTSYFIAQWIQSTQENIGLGNKNAPLRAVVVPFVFMTTIEVFDGFSQGWGFSVADFTANSIGLTSFYLQNRYWNDQRFLLKYSFNQSQYASVRPELLGNTLAEQMLKDYNSQTYWLSYPIKNLWPSKNNRIPSYLSLSLGYGIDGFVGARSNTWQGSSGIVDLSTIKRQKEWYLSLDIDLKKIPIKGRAWQLFTSSIRWIKLPAPAISFRKDTGFGLHPVLW